MDERDSEQQAADGSEQRTRPANPVEGVRIIGAEEAQAAIEAGQVAGRRPEDAPRFGDVPPPPEGPRPPLRFPMGDRGDPSQVPRQPVAAPRPGAEPPPGLQHWTEPPTGDHPRILPDTEPEGGDEDLGGWSSFASSGPRWRDQPADWEEADYEDGALLGDEDRLGALDPSRPGVADSYSFEEDELAPAEPATAVGPDEAGAGAEVRAPVRNPADALTPRAPTRAERGRGRLGRRSGPAAGGAGGARPAVDARAGARPGVDAGPAGRPGVDPGGGGGRGADPRPWGEDGPGAIWGEDRPGAAWGGGADPSGAGPAGGGGAHSGVRLTSGAAEDDAAGPAAPPAPRQVGSRPVPSEPGTRASLGGPAGQGRGAGGAAGGGRDIGSAVGTGLAVGVAFLVALKVGPGATVVLVTAFLVMAAAELFAALRHRGYQPATLLGLVATASLSGAAYWKGEQAFPLVLALFVIFGLLWYLTGVVRANPALNVGATLLAFCYVGFLGSFAALALRLPNDDGLGVLLGAVIATAAYDIAGFFVGSRMGNTPLAPAVSPGKTVEGLVGGTLGAVLASLVIVQQIHPWDFASAFALGLVAAAGATLGDLCESMIKRDLDIKDMGTVLPGHGGVLDRIDGLLFVVPAAYELVKLLDRV